MSVTVRRTCAMELVVIAMDSCCQSRRRDDFPAPPVSALSSMSRTPAGSIKVTIISTDTVSADRDRAERPSWVRKVGIIISVLVTAFLGFDAVGKLAAVPQAKEGTQALGFPPGQALVMGIVLAVCVVVYVIPRTAVLG